MITINKALSLIPDELEFYRGLLSTLGEPVSNLRVSPYCGQGDFSVDSNVGGGLFLFDIGNVKAANFLPANAVGRSYYHGTLIIENHFAQIDGGINPNPTASSADHLVTGPNNDMTNFVYSRYVIQPSDMLYPSQLNFVRAPIQFNDVCFKYLRKQVIHLTDPAALARHVSEWYFVGKRIDF